MTPNPECATVDTPIVDALHTMHEGKFLHLPIVDRGLYISNVGLKFVQKLQEIINTICYVPGCFNVDGVVVAVTDVLNITHGSIAAVS